MWFEKYFSHFKWCNEDTHLKVAETQTKFTRVYFGPFKPSVILIPHDPTLLDYDHMFTDIVMGLAVRFDLQCIHTLNSNAPLTVVQNNSKATIP